MNQNLKILFLASEAVPFAKTGGLADVAGALPVVLNRLGADVRLVLPFYRTIRDGNFPITPRISNLDIPLGSTRLSAPVLETRIRDRIPVYLVERDELYDRSGLYGNGRGDYYDNIERFSFFCHGALALISKLPFIPDIIHCHDWQTGLIPALISGPDGTHPTRSRIPVIFTIHNIGYQGLFPPERLSITGLPKGPFFNVQGLEYWKKISLLKAGIVYSDAITTVSPTHAREILTPEYGMGMEGVLGNRRAVLHGILNGIDYGIWDPKRDPLIPARYTPQDRSGKRRCKESLIKEFGLEPFSETRPIIALISRLDQQKGLDLLLEILDSVMELDLNILILGSGNKTIERDIQAASEHHAGRFGIKVGFDENLAHRLMAGSDIFLIPSRYEPCGLTQMAALKYGSVPLVRATGGLEDSVRAFDPRTGKGNGFKFRSLDSSDLLKAIREAAELFGDRHAWNRIMAHGMNEDFSWDRSAAKYMELYENVMSAGPSDPVSWE